MVVNGGPYHSLVIPYFNHVDLTNHSTMAGKAVLICRPNSHPFVDRTLSLEQPVKIGRSVARARAAQGNGIFDCKVLSRNHALIWYNNGKFYLQDTKSSNGTFVNNQRLSKSGEESLAREVCSGDIVQFGVDVLENARKVTHGCIVANLKLYLPDGKEAKARRFQSGKFPTKLRLKEKQKKSNCPTPKNPQFPNLPEFESCLQRNPSPPGSPCLPGCRAPPGSPTISEGGFSPSTSVLSGTGTASVEELYQLNQHIQVRISRIRAQEAMQREQMLQAKLDSLQELVASLRQTADLSWRALIAEDRLISRIEMLENQLQTCSKNFAEDKLREELRKLQEDKDSYQGVAKDCLQKVLQEKLEVVQKCAELEKDLHNAEVECLNFKTNMQRDMDEIRELAQKHNLQMIKTIELQMKFEQSESSHKEEMEKLEAENEDLRNQIKMLLANEEVLQEKIQVLEASGALVGRQLLGIQSQFGLNQSPDIHNHLSSLKQRNGSIANVICKNEDDEELKDENQKDNSNIDSLITQLIYTVEKQKNAKEVLELTEAKVSLLQDEKMAKLQTINSIEGQIEMYLDKLYEQQEDQKRLESNLTAVEDNLKEKMESKKDNDTTKMNGSSDRILNSPLESVVESLTTQINDLKDEIYNMKLDACFNNCKFELLADMIKETKSNVEATEKTIALRQADLKNTKDDLSEDTTNWLTQNEKLQEAQRFKEETDLAVNTLREQFKSLENSFSQMKEKSDEDPEHIMHKEANTCVLLRKQLQDAQQLAKQNKNESELLKERLREVMEEYETTMSKIDPSYSRVVAVPTPDSAICPTPVPVVDNKSVEEMAQSFHERIHHLESEIKILRDECDQKEKELEASKDKESIIQKLRSRVSEMEEELVLVKEKFMSCNEKNTQLEKELVDLKQDYDTVVHQPYFNVVFVLPLLVLFVAMTIAFYPTLSILMGTAESTLPSLPESEDPSDPPESQDS